MHDATAFPNVSKFLSLLPFAMTSSSVHNNNIDECLHEWIKLFLAEVRFDIGALYTKSFIEACWATATTISCQQGQAFAELQFREYSIW